MTAWRFSAEAILDALNKIECMHEFQNIFLFGYRTPISDALGLAFGFDFSRKRLALSDIKKILGDAKK